ncbi:hypothetical protein B0J14DRAFT_71810 [Halenospora varia]|nr:hypothetical protein B0J14DRAFT_71810 [Halenospora varia]
METLQRLENLVTHVSTQQQSSFGSLESRASRIKSLISVESGFHGAGSRRCSISREENDTDENISDFLKLLERKKALQSIKGSIEASGRPISDQLSKFQAMRESNDSLPVSMSSSLTDLNSVYNEPNNKTDEINSLSDRTSTGCSWVSPKGLEGCDNIFQELGSLFATRLQHQRSPERSEHAMPYIRTPERSDEGSHIHTMPYICTCCPKNMQAFTSEKDLNEHQQRKASIPPTFTAWFRATIGAQRQKSSTNQRRRN